MKRLFTILLTAALTVVMSGCSSGASSEDARTVASKFTEAFVVDLNPDKMAKYCGAEGLEEMDEDFFTPRKNSPELYGLLTAGIKDMKLSYKINEEKSRIEDDEALVWFDFTSARDDSYDGSAKVELDREDGKWLVNEWSFDLM